MNPHSDLAPDGFEVLGVGINRVTMRQVIEAVESMVESGRGGYFVFCTVSSVLLARKDPLVEKAIREATVVTPDGMPLVWLGSREGEIERVYGPDFMVELFSTTGDQLSHFFYGGRPLVVERMVESLKTRFPDLRVAGYASPPENSPVAAPDRDLQLINASGADVVWVGLGHPKQELWMHANRPSIDAPVLAGVGAAFDFLSGTKKEAPDWMKRSGLQWLHRLLSEPRRLWRRYLVGNTRFVVLLLVDSLKRRFRGQRQA